MNEVRKEPRRLSYIKNGVRYAKCVECGKQWNIAIGQIVLSDGYVCPKCYDERNERKCVN